MRRLFVLILWAACSLPLAFAGMPGADSLKAVAVAAQNLQPAAPSTVVTERLLPCASHTGATAAGDRANGPPCDGSPGCQVCSLCQLCHAAALQTADRHPPDLSGATSFMPLFTADYVSADPARGLRPPIL